MEAAAPTVREVGNPADEVVAPLLPAAGSDAVERRGHVLRPEVDEARVHPCHGVLRSGDVGGDRVAAHVAGEECPAEVAEEHTVEYHDLLASLERGGQRAPAIERGVHDALDEARISREGIGYSRLEGRGVVEGVERMAPLALVPPTVGYAQRRELALEGVGGGGLAGAGDAFQ